MSKKLIYNRLYKEVYAFMHDLPSEFKGRLGNIHFYFEMNGFAFSNGQAVLAEYNRIDNSITFYLDTIKQAGKTSKKDLRTLIKHEIGHVFQVPEERLPQLN